MFKLYQKQQEVYDEINKHLFNTPYMDNPLLNKKMYLSGEMGSGKTYIGSRLMIEYVKNNDYGLVVTPAQVLNKWIKVLKSAAETYDKKIKVVELKRKTILDAKGDIHYNKNTVYVITDNALKIFINNNIKKIASKDTYPFCIFDEIHKYKKAPLTGIYQLTLLDFYNKLSCEYNSSDEVEITEEQFDENYKNGKYNDSINKKVPMLFLTGTIFNKSWEEIFKLISLSHKKLCREIDANNFFKNTFKSELKINIRNNNKETEVERLTNFDFNYQYNQMISTALNLYNKMANIYSFINLMWQYISISISLNDVKELEQSNNKEEIKQEIMPIKPFELENEQKMFIKVVQSQLSNLNFSNKNAIQYAMEYIDYPNKDLAIVNKAKGRRDKFKTDKLNVVSFPLKPIKFSETIKYKKLLSLLKEDKKKENNFLIYCTDESLENILKEQLEKDGHTAFIVDNKVSKKKYADFIKENFKNNQVCIVDPRKISEGIDISADVLVWYQLIQNHSQALQATRRVYRLSSTKKSSVYFLIYKNTEQERLVNELSNATKNNAATQGEQSEDNLSKLTGILLGELDS